MKMQRNTQPHTSILQVAARVQNHLYIGNIIVHKSETVYYLIIGNSLPVHQLFCIQYISQMSATCNRQGHAQMLNIPSLTVLPALMNALPTVIHVSWMRFQFVCMLYLVYKKLIFCRYSFHSIASFGRTNFLLIQHLIC